MKGIASYIAAIGIVSILTIAVFFIVGELLSRERDVSVISSKVSTTINEIEFSKFYFKKYLENEVNSLRSAGASDNNIIKGLKGKIISLELENSKTSFKVNGISINGGKITVDGNITAYVQNKDFKIDAEYSAKFIYNYKTT